MKDFFVKFEEFLVWTVNAYTSISDTYNTDNKVEKSQINMQMKSHVTILFPRWFVIPLSSCWGSFFCTYNFNIIAF